MANRLQVGYQTLLTHLVFNLKKISIPKYKSLKKRQRRKILEQIYPDLEFESNILKIEDTWDSQYTEILISDLLLLDDTETIKTQILYDEKPYNGYRVIKFKSQGMAAITNIKINRVIQLGIRDNNFIGRSIYRNLEL